MITDLWIISRNFSETGRTRISRINTNCSGPTRGLVFRGGWVYLSSVHAKEFYDRDTNQAERRRVLFCGVSFGRAFEQGALYQPVLRRGGRDDPARRARSGGRCGAIHFKNRTERKGVSALAFQVKSEGDSKFLRDRDFTAADSRDGAVIHGADVAISLA